MKKRKPDAERTLKHDDKVLWNLVTRTVSPMKPRIALSDDALSFEEHMAQQIPGHTKKSAMGKAGLRAAKIAAHATHKSPPKTMTTKTTTTKTTTPKLTPSPQPIVSHIDKPVYRKISKGRLAIDSQIDLHNMTQDQAVYRLEAFLNEARIMGHRHVLVITGKGGSPTSEGVLRRMLPIWLNTPRFSSVVNGYQSASRGHGGDGAFYVRLRRLR